MNEAQFRDQVLGAASLWLQGYTDPVDPGGPQYRVRLLRDAGDGLTFEARQVGDGVVNGRYHPDGTTSRFHVMVEVMECTD